MKAILLILAALCAFFFAANAFVLLFSGFTALNAVAAVMNLLALIILVPQISKV